MYKRGNPHPFLLQLPRILIMFPVRQQVKHVRRRPSTFAVRTADRRRRAKVQLYGDSLAKAAEADRHASEFVDTLLRNVEVEVERISESLVRALVVAVGALAEFWLATRPAGEELRGEGLPFLGEGG